MNRETARNQLKMFGDITTEYGAHHNIFLIGPPTVGKTTLGDWYFNYLDVEPTYITGDRFEVINTAIEHDQFLFVDEIQGLRNTELLYPFLISEFNTTFFCTIPKYLKGIDEALLRMCFILEIEHEEE